jgi:hypothetical protein
MNDTAQMRIRRRYAIMGLLDSLSSDRPLGDFAAKIEMHGFLMVRRIR